MWNVIQCGISLYVWPVSPSKLNCGIQNRQSWSRHGDSAVAAACTVTRFVERCVQGKDPWLATRCLSLVPRRGVEATRGLSLVLEYLCVCPLILTLLAIGLGRERLVKPMVVTCSRLFSISKRCGCIAQEWQSSPKSQSQTTIFRGVFRVVKRESLELQR